MKLHRWIIGVFVLVFGLGIITRSHALSALYNSTVRIVSSTGTVLDGVASATTANYNSTVRVVDSSGNVIDSFGTTANGVTTLSPLTGTGTAGSPVAVATSSAGNIASSVGGFGNRTIATPWQQFGDGSDGPINCSGNLSGVSTTGIIYATTFTVALGNTCTLNTLDHPLVVRATGTCTIAGTITATAAAGGEDQAAQGLCGSGGGGGGGTAAGAVGGACTNSAGFGITCAGGTVGGAGGGAGGNGSTLATTRLVLDRGPEGLNMAGGASGGAGGSTGGAGGKGGLSVLLICKTIDFTGTINTSGANGTGSPGNNQGGGGGGAPGTVVMAAESYTHYTGTVTQTAGTGGTCGAFTGCGAGGTAGVDTAKCNVQLTIQ